MRRDEAGAHCASTGRPRRDICFRVKSAHSLRLSAGLWFGLCFMAQLALGAAPANTTTSAPPDLSGYRTVAQAITTKVRKERAVRMGQPGYLGVEAAPVRNGHPVVEDVDPDSPAAKAGLRRGDVLVRVNGDDISNDEELREAIQSRTPGDRVRVSFKRGGRPMDVVVTLAAVSRPLQLSGEHVLVGVRFTEPKDGEGLKIVRLTPDLPAAKSGLKLGDRMLKFDGVPLFRASDFADGLADKRPGDRMKVTVERGDREFDVTLVLAPNPAAGAAEMSWYNRKFWSNSVYRLAVVLVEFSDVKRNPRITDAAWQQSLFSVGAYRNRNNATGQPAQGSVNDYYREQSCGALRFEGRMFGPVQSAKQRADYLPGTSAAQKTAFFTEALDAVLARHGANALDNADGLLFIHAGARVPLISRGSLYWPHRGNTTYRGRKWPYVICQEGGARMSPVSLFAHELGHMLGLPDLYARPENPGSEGAGVWCAMSNHVPGPRPRHFSAWCKIQLGWLKPAVIDPTVKQKLILAPVAGSTTECFKVLARSDGSEYFLLENRRKKGFDESLPDEGLFIWRVVRERPALEESHGVEGPMGPRVYLHSVPYPSASNNAFTSYTTPPSRSFLGGGLPVFITQIRKLDDGRITFHIGYDYQ